MKQFLYLLTIIFALTFLFSVNVYAQTKKPKKDWSHGKKMLLLAAAQELPPVQ
ncbi:MAG: hypothetical protein ABI863_23070 [Ginsengibacter sp.]